MQQKLLTIVQVASYLNVDKFTIYRLVAEKKIPAFKVGCQWRFKRSLIDAWLMRNSNVQRKNTTEVDSRDERDERSGF